MFTRILDRLCYAYITRRLATKDAAFARKVSIEHAQKTFVLQSEIDMALFEARHERLTRKPKYPMVYRRSDLAALAELCPGALGDETVEGQEAWLPSTQAAA